MSMPLCGARGTRAARAIDGCFQIDSRYRHLPEVVERAIDDFAFATDAIELRLVGRDVTLVRNRKALFGIGVLIDGDFHVDAIGSHRYRARPRIKRNAYNCFPAIGIPHYQDRPVVEAHCRHSECGGTDINDRHAAGTPRVFACPRGGHAAND
jgi:hypothetical protein